MIRSRIGLLVLAALVPSVGPAQGQNGSDLVAQIESLKGVRLPEDEEGQKALRKRLADIWEFIQQHEAEAVPLFIARLRTELDAPQPDNFFLVNTGSFLASRKEATALGASWMAIKKVHPDDPLCRAFPSLLFIWAHTLSRTGDARVLRVLDLILTRDHSLVIQEHSLQLTPFLVRVFLYGAAGVQSEPHLLASLEANPDLTGRTIAVSSWIGSEQSARTAKRVIDSGVCDESLLSAAVVLARFGGPPGKRRSDTSLKEEVRW